MQKIGYIILMVITQTPFSFGNNPSLPSILTNEVPPMEENAKKLTFECNSRIKKAFLERETNENLPRSIRCKLKPVSLIYELRDQVYYKHNDSSH